MAGLGSKKFPAFSKLSSDDVNGYLSSQVIMRFATTAARDAAFGGTGEFTLAEGMTCYIDADNSMYTYDGSNWIKMVSASTPPAVSLIRTASFSSISSVAPLDISDVFTTEFEYYQLRMNYTASHVSAFFIDIQLRDTGGAVAGAAYTGNLHRGYGTTHDAVPFFNATAFKYGALNYVNAKPTNVVMDIFGPAQTDIRTNFLVHSSTPNTSGGVGYVSQCGGFYDSSNAMTGLRIFPDTSSATIAGRYSLYGYRN